MHMVPDKVVDMDFHVITSHASELIMQLIGDQVVIVPPAVPSIDRSDQLDSLAATTVEEPAEANIV